MWIPSHYGINSNEGGDLLTNQAISSFDYTDIKSLPYKCILRTIKRISFQQWYLQWGNTTNNKSKYIKKPFENGDPH